MSKITHPPKRKIAEQILGLPLNLEKIETLWKLDFYYFQKQKQFKYYSDLFLWERTVKPFDSIFLF